MKRLLQITTQLLPLLFSVFIVAVIVFEMTVYSSPLQSTATISDSDGIAYLSVSSLKSPEIAEEHFQARKREQRDKLLKEMQYNNLVKSIEDDEVNIWSFFKDYAMLGDSRALDFCNYNYLSYSRVFAENGSTLNQIDKHMRDIKSLNPSTIYICYGLNDILHKSDYTADDYANTVLKKVKKIRKELPEANIIVSSILWCTDNVIAKQPAYKKIPSFNDACKKMCLDNNIAYADNDSICREYIGSLWGPDGIHPSHGFYPHWGKNLIIASLQYQFD